MRPRRTLVATLLLFGAAFVGVASCREPTQMVVSFKTNACGDAPDLGIVTAPSLQEAQRRVAGGELTTTQTACVAPSMLGTLTLTPGGESGGTVVAVLALRGKRPEDCLRDPSVAGCITSRRRFAFLAHTPLAIEISLDLDCEGKACDAFTTCSRGSCVDARVECESNGTCSEPGHSLDGGLLPDAPPLPEAGPIPLPDGSLPLDGSTPDLCPARKTCRNGLGCASTELCCLLSDPGTSCSGSSGGGSCAVKGCCASDVPCPAGSECCAEVGQTTCVPGTACTAPRLCATGTDCRAGEVCSPLLGAPILSARGNGTLPPPLYCMQPDGGGPVVRDGGVSVADAAVAVTVP